MLQRLNMRQWLQRLFLVTRLIARLGHILDSKPSMRSNGLQGLSVPLTSNLNILCVFVILFASLC